MSQEAVEIVRAFQPPREVDLTEIFVRDDDGGMMTAALAAVEPMLTDDFVCAFNGVTYGERRGLAGLREVWLDWLGPWTSYRVGDKEFVDHGDRVLVLVRDYGRRDGISDEVELLAAAVYTVRDGRIARAEYYAQRADAYAALGVDAPS